MAFGAARPEFRHAEPARRRQQYRHRDRHARRSRRLHHPGRRPEQRAQCVALPPSQFQFPDRHRAGCDGRQRALRRADDAIAARQDHSGADRLRQGQSGQDQFCVRRHRHGVAYLRPVVHDHGRNRAGACPLPHQLHAGLDRRPGADGDQSDSASGGIRQNRQSARAGGDDEGTAGRTARPADGRPIRARL